MKGGCPFTRENASQMARRSVEARERRRAEQKALDSAEGELANSRREIKKAMALLEHALERVERAIIGGNAARPIPAAVEAPKIPRDGHPAPAAEAQATARHSDGADGTVHPPGGAGRQDATASYIAELDARNAECREAEEAERGRQERRERLLESRFRKW